MTLQGLLLVSIIILVIVIILFAILERIMKNSPKKNTEKASPKVVKELPKVTEETTKIENPINMKIYNNELADDLNEIINKSNNKDKRLQIENHLNKKGNIANYIQSKNYHGFNFDTEEVVNEEVTDEDVPTFTKEDYKRIMAFSNIDDKKSL